MTKVILKRKEVPSVHERIYDQLATIVGPEYVSDRNEELFLYCQDFITTVKPGRCDFVVMPETAEEVRQIVRLANREKIPVVPWVSGINMGGTCIPREGGIVLDLRRMNKVLEVNEDDMYAIVEGGITWADLQRHLMKNNPNMRAGITFSPPATGVIPCYLNYGFVDLGMVGGNGSEFINGLEVVLPTGEIVLVGSCMGSTYWYGRQPMPDLAGLFIGWLGTTGIVTKASIKLWPNLLTKTLVIMAENAETGFKTVNRLAKAGLGIIDICGVNYVWFTHIQGFKISPDIPFEGEIDFYSLITVTAYTPKEIEAKVEALTKIAEEEGVEVNPTIDVLELFPENERGEFPNLLYVRPFKNYGCWDAARGGGGEWIGSYVSSRHQAEYYKTARDVGKKHGKHVGMYFRIMGGGHYNIIRCIVNFNKNDPEDVECTRKCLMEMDEAIRKIPSAIRYKPEYWAMKRNLERANPATVELMRRIRRLLDPNGILNPGQGIE